MKIFVPIIIIAGLIAFLIFSAVEESSKKVLTVKTLKSEATTKKRIRLGARVSGEITIANLADDTHKKQVEFMVKDPEVSEAQLTPLVDNNLPTKSVDEIKVIYKGVMPDTLKEERDVILEGDYIIDHAEGIFYASTLNTQCPSKYKPPKPGTERTY